MASIICLYVVTCLVISKKYWWYDKNIYKKRVIKVSKFRKQIFWFSFEGTIIQTWSTDLITILLFFQGIICAPYATPSYWLLAQWKSTSKMTILASHHFNVQLAKKWFNRRVIWKLILRNNTLAKKDCWKKP